MYSLDLLIVACQCLKLHAKAQVAADSNALLARHGNNGCSIVLKYLHHSSWLEVCTRGSEELHGMRCRHGWHGLTDMTGAEAH